MKSLSYSEFGDPAAVLSVVEQPLPEPKADEVRIKLVLAPIHNHDLWTIKGAYGYKPPLPAIAGSEAVGVIDQLGANASGLQVGQRVVASGVHGSWSECFVAKAASLLPLPADIPDEIAAQLIAMPLSTSMLLKMLNAPAGSWIIQNAANGAVGKTLAVLAKAQGIQVINLVRRAEAAAELSALGIEHVVVTSAADWKEQVMAITQGQSIIRAIDSLSGAAARDLLDLLAEGGVFVSFGSAMREPIMVTAADLIFRQITLKGFWGAKAAKDLDAASQKQMLQDLVSLAQQGQLTLPVAGIFTLDEVQVALAAQANPQRNGKVLFKAA
jgi:NADPH2:quinone reductase